MAKVIVDGRELEMADDQNLLHGCLSHGLDLPYFCWHPTLGSAGACRLCAVKQFNKPTEKDGKLIEDTKGRVVMSCMTPAKGVHAISITDPEAAEFRKSVVEWLMTNHPHDCPVCDAGGACHLQDMTVLVGHNYRKHRFKKRTYRNQNLGPMVNHEMNRCIQCYRCVRYYQDYAGGTDLSAQASKNHVYFGREADGTLESEFSGNLVEVCPTGVFTDKTMKRHYSRKWDLQMAPSVCTHCSLGCNVTPGERYGTVRGVGNRYNHEVNGYFLCDRGRYGYEFLTDEKRLREPRARVEAAMQPISPEQAMSELEQAARDPNVVGLGSPRASLEANFALWKLVGPHRFYAGVSAAELGLTHRALAWMRTSGASTPTMQEIENADAALVLGEDLNETAPRLALALRQTAFRPMQEAAVASGTPAWNDIPVRVAATGQVGDLFIATTKRTRLADCARENLAAAPAELARLGFAVAHAIDDAAPSVPDLSPALTTLARTIAASLLRAKRPMVVSGVHSGEPAILDAAANVAMALTRKGKAAGLSFVFPEANSVGLALLTDRPIDEALAKMSAGARAIVLENDLFRRTTHAKADQAMSASRAVVLDHSRTPTVDRAALVLPTSAFTEDTGTFVNNEGRAQRYFEVHVPPAPVRSAWQWLCQAPELEQQFPRHFDGLVDALEAAFPSLAEVGEASADANFRFQGLKIARQSHRYSGRTAMDAHIDVVEKKPPTDPDSPFAFSMEGASGKLLGPLAAFFWAPNWNSNQAANKFQSKIGGALRGRTVGRRVVHPAESPAPYASDVPAAFQPDAKRLLFVPGYHAFGSEELSARAPAVAERAAKPAVRMNAEDASSGGLDDGAIATVQIGGAMVRVPVTVDASVPSGVAILSVGLVGSPTLSLPAYGQAGGR
jgi:NADH-quinone oxidoreductase subunit G